MDWPLLDAAEGNTDGGGAAAATGGAPPCRLAFRGFLAVGVVAALLSVGALLRVGNGVGATLSPDHGGAMAATSSAAAEATTPEAGDAAPVPSPPLQQRTWEGRLPLAAAVNVARPATGVGATEAGPLDDAAAADVSGADDTVGSAGAPDVALSLPPPGTPPPSPNPTPGLSPEAAAVRAAHAPFFAALDAVAYPGVDGRRRSS